MSGLWERDSEYDRPKRVWFWFCLSIVVVIFLVWITPSSCSAFTLDISKTIEFFAGGLASCGVHEGGHWAALEYYDKDYDFYFHRGYWPRYTYRGGSKNAIQMSGLTATMLVDEGVLLFTDKERRTFWKGYLFFSSINQIAYPTIRYNSGDFKYMKGKEKDIFVALSVAHGLFNFIRLYHEDGLKVESWIGASEKGTPMGGFRIQW